MKAPGAPPRPVESPFAEEMRSRAQQIQRRHAWKTEGRGAMFMSRGLLWGPPGREDEGLSVLVTSLCRGTTPGCLLYTLLAEGRTAVCRLRLEDGVERRLLHGSERRLQELCASPERDEVACSVAHPDGTATLAVMTGEAADLAEVTEGEVRDAAPSWVPCATRQLVYESAGVGRDGQGRFVGLGPSAIHRIDLERGTVEELASDPGRDLLRPRAAADGSLYYVTRPRRADRPAAWRLALDLLLLPVRLLYAVFQYLSFFTTKYTGRPLTTAGGARRQGADLRQMQVWSNLISAGQAAEESTDDVPSVPRSWQLVRRAKDGRCETLAEGVVAFDLDEAGNVVYSTGTALHLRDAAGARTKLVTQPAISHVVFAG